jgi:hypothetical protein
MQVFRRRRRLPRDQCPAAVLLPGLAVVPRSPSNALRHLQVRARVSRAK